MLKSIFAVGFIFVCTSIAWMTLGTAVTIRTSEQEADTRTAVGELWGDAQVQEAPRAQRIASETQRIVRQEDGKEVVETVERLTMEAVPLTATDVHTSFALEHRRKGLLWYPTYTVDFRGLYVMRNPAPEPATIRIRFVLPTGARMLDDFRFNVGGDDLDLAVENSEVTRDVVLDAGSELAFEVAYRTQGVGTWRYTFGEKTTEVRQFNLAMSTDFDDIDFPAGTMSPTSKTRAGGGWTLEWRYARLVADAGIGIEMPQKLNPGPWVSRVTFFAPVSLFLFFFALFVFSIIRGVRLHPMHYFFLAAGFFAFHLLLAYLVDHVSVALAVVISSVVSVGLVTSYMRLVVNRRFALMEVGVAQLVYLVGFAYTFFLEGYTGLTITVLSIITLFLVMQATARIDWEEVFRSGPSPAVAQGS